MASRRAGPFRIKSSVKVTDRGYNDLMRRVEQAKKAALAVGITAETGAEPHDKGDSTTVLEIGTYHEFGMGVPERSFIRGWYDSFKDRAQAIIKRVMEEVIAGRRTKASALELLGVRFVAECQKYMVSAPFAPLAQATIRRKGSSKPLIDTGQLRSSITYRIELK